MEKDRDTSKPTIVLSRLLNPQPLLSAHYRGGMPLMPGGGPATSKASESRNARQMKM